MTERLSENQMLSIYFDAEHLISVDRDYTHKDSGRTYTVSGFVFLEKTMELMVEYYDPYVSSISFARPIPEFLEKFE